MCLLKKVLSLTKKCDANKWVEVEQLVLKNVSSLDKSSTVQVSRHFG